MTSTGTSTSASRRELQAAATRSDILDAALALFARRGYGATTVAEIAAAAEVAAPTVYASVGNKQHVLRALLARADERAAVAELEPATRTGPDAASVLAAQVAIGQRVAEHSGDVIAALCSAASVDTGLTALLAERVARHVEGCRAAVERIHELGALRDGCAVEQATAILATMTEHTVFAHLVQHFGWSFASCGAWLGETLAGQLLRPDAAGPSVRSTSESR